MWNLDGLRSKNVTGRTFVLRTCALASCFVNATFGVVRETEAQVDVAEYSITFDAHWSAASHPDAYPGGAHFSPLIGATHNTDVTFWSVGQLATRGIQNVAETGGTGTFTSEIAAAIESGSALEQFLAPGITSPNRVSTSFSIQATHPLVTAVTMIAPSPDWFVGVSGVELLVDGHWLDEAQFDLVAYDAGTDSGIDFTSRNLATDPHVPIAGFDGPPFAGTDPLGTFTLRRIVLQAGDANQDLVVNFDDILGVLSGGKFETGQPATWGEGDWDGAPGGRRGSPPAGDGLFNFDDILAALGTGLFETGPYASRLPQAAMPGPSVAVPEPPSVIPLGMGILALMLLRSLRVALPQGHGIDAER